MPIKNMCPRCRRVIEYNQNLCVECTSRKNKDYDRTRRDKTSQAFYNSDSWRKIRAVVINKYHGLDLYELVINKQIVYADTVHHIEELKVNPDRALDPSNLIPLSASTHARIHKEYDKGASERKDMQRILFGILKG